MKLNDIIQWLGAAFIIVGHVTNAIGPAAYPWNIAAFTLGTAAFLTWAFRVLNKPQMAVNIVALATFLIGLVTAWR